MRKRLISPISGDRVSIDDGALELINLATVEITSEDTAFPIEHALQFGSSVGWRAAAPGIQTIRLIFDEPQKLRRIWIAFEENQVHRTQEFVLRWSPDKGQTFRQIIRQQWNFSSPDATRETEDYTVDLSNVTLLDLTIEPDKENGKAHASLLSLRLA
jgi:hypothetical protein